MNLYYLARKDQGLTRGNWGDVISRSVYGCILLSIVLGASLYGQEVPLGKTSLGAGIYYSPTSSRILIGASRDRRIAAVDFDYSRLLHSGKVGIYYDGTITPALLEADLAIIGTIQNNGAYGQPTYFYKYSTPVRVVAEAPPRTSSGSGGAFNNLVYGRMQSYAFAAEPFGVRANFAAHHRIQPLLMASGGFIYGQRPLPLDDATNFNFLFSFGAGFEVLESRHQSIRFEYMLRHMSDANMGTENPGVDNQTIRLTWSHRR